MNNSFPSVTVLIAARPEQEEIKAVKGSRGLDYPADKLEIIVARGKQPSVQRNAGMRLASGELICFLDDDSVPQRDLLRRAIPYFADPQVQMVGGPNICPAESPPLEQAFALVLSSWLAFGPSRARYTPVGRVRDSSEKELILCNMVARRQPMLDLGGFNEALYPNEENALMDELQKRGGRLVYDPQLVVYRRPRPTLKAFIKMLRTYGRGRAEQFRLHPTARSALNFVPPAFCVYLVLIAVMALLGRMVPWPAWWWQISLLPLAMYAVAVVGQTVVLVPAGGLWRSLAAMPLIVLTHLLYGYGFWRGLFTPLKPAREVSTVPVKLETLKP